MHLTSHLIKSAPVPIRNDIISGPDFLSLFITEDAVSESVTQHTNRFEGLSTPVAVQEDEMTPKISGDLGNDFISLSISQTNRFEESTRSTTTSTLVTRFPEVGVANETMPLSSGQKSTPAPPIITNKRVVIRRLPQQRKSLIKLDAIEPTLSTITKNIVSTELPVNSHPSELPLVDEVDDRDLLNSESKNIVRVAEVPSGVDNPFLTSTLISVSKSSFAGPMYSMATKAIRTLMTTNTNRAQMLDSAGAPDSHNENLERNLPFTLHLRPVVDEVEEVTDLAFEASNNDQLMQERQRMSTSRPRIKQKEIGVVVDIKMGSPVSLPTYETVTYNSNPQNHYHEKPPHPLAENTIRLPVPRSIAYASLSQEYTELPATPQYQAKVYSEPAKIYGEPAKVYSEPAKVYGEPSKVYSEPEKTYSVPAKFYSEPSKIYSEPAKIYSEPAKIYSEPAKNYGVAPTQFPPGISSTTTTESSTTSAQSGFPSKHKIIFNLDKLPYDFLNAPNRNESLRSAGHPSRGDDRDVVPVVADKVAVGSFGNPSTNKTSMLDVGVPSIKGGTEDTSKQNLPDNNKVGYVVEGRKYRKYRVEEKTPDGFIVGEYGVVSHNDGNLRGVRYTADSNINPRLIYDALLKFLSL